MTDEYLRVTLFRRLDGSFYDKPYDEGKAKRHGLAEQPRDNANRIVLLDMPSLFVYYINSTNGPLVFWISKDLLE